MKHLDESKPYGTTHGDPNVCFKQGGYDFDSSKTVIPGSGPKNGNVESVAKVIEKKSKTKAPALLPLTENQKAKVQQYTEGSTLQELQKFATTTYAMLEERGVKFTKVAGGKGKKLRLAEFLARHIDN